MSQRKVANPLALAVLSCLNEKPMHPYEIATTLRERHVDEAIKLNYGSLYSVIEALTRERFIEATAKLKEGKRPERTVYRLTEPGQLELHDWLSELLSQPAKEYTQFEAGLSLMPALPPSDAVALLRRRCEMLELAQASARAVLSQLRAKSLPRLYSIDLEHRIMLREAELTWVRNLANEIGAGTLDGTARWQSGFTP